MNAFNFISDRQETLTNPKQYQDFSVMAKDFLDSQIDLGDEILITQIDQDVQDYKLPF
jgi:hypothetical protein